MTKKTPATTKGRRTGFPSKDDRGMQRIPIQLLVDYRSNGNYLFDFCKDLGTGGIFIQTTSPLTQGSDVDLTFTIPDSKETLSARGKVIWVQSPVVGRNDLTPGMGVQFADFSASQRKVLEDFVTRYHKSKESIERTKGKSA